MVRNATSSAMSAWASARPDFWPSEDRPLALDSITSRHHSPSVFDPACAARSNWAYSSSLTLVPIDLVRRVGFTIQVAWPKTATQSNQAVRTRYRRLRHGTCCSSVELIFSISSHTVTEGYRTAPI